MQSLHQYFSPLETASRDQIQDHHWKSLRNLLKIVYENNSFYRKKWQAAGIQSWADIHNLEEFKNLPFVSRQELSKDQVENPPYGTNLTWPIGKYTKWYRTSGTKGKPLIVLATSEDSRVQGRTWCYNFAGAGVQPGDIIYVAFSFGPFAGLWGVVPGADMANILMIPGGGQPTLQRIKFILEHGATVVASIPSYALRMIEVAKENNIDLRKSRVRTLLNGGEAGASIPAIRARIEEAWGAKVYDTTGLTEAGHHGFECQAQNGVHMIESEFLVEIFEPGTSHPVPDGEVGEMVITALTRTGMPIIRYRTGDLVRYSTQQCNCGRTFGQLKGGILSRTDGMITVRGINVYPTTLEDCLMSLPEVTEFHVNIFDKKGMKELQIQIEAERCDKDPNIISRKIVDDLYQRLSLRADVQVVQPGTLPRSPGKAKRFSYHL